MANPEHLKILKQGVKAWNAWRDEHNTEQIDLNDADLSHADLGGVYFRDANLIGAKLYSSDLSHADLSHADLNGADLSHADLSHAYLNRANINSSNLNRADLSSADLSGANIIGAKLFRVNLSDVNLSDANLSGAKLFRANFSGADLSRANISGAELIGARLSDANLNHADLIGANLAEASLICANLNSADLSYANLTDATLKKTNLSAAKIRKTTFGNVDLSDVIGLVDVVHKGPSTVSIDTLYKSQGKIPEAFLRGCGVPEEFIKYVPALVGAVEPIQYYSVFISYSSKDQAFAERLHADLQSKKIRCWFAPEDLKIGDKFRVAIDEGIRGYDKLLLVLSEYSVGSDWVEKEVETGMEKERQQKRTMLFPIRLDDAVMKVETGWPADVRRTRQIGDFKNWKDHDAYKEAFNRLMRDLKADEKVRT
jgi:uncharacterized protein YjbI with pentapeptide repeats